MSGEPTPRELMNAIVDLHGAMVAGFTRTEQRFDSIDSRFDALERRIGALETRSS